jgi:carbon-monoxide dehydrogenase medium subunit
VKPAPLTYRAPADLEEAVALRAEFAEDSALLAGGQSLIPLLNFRLARPSVVIDLGALRGLDGIEREGGQLVVGAMARQRDVELSQTTSEACPLLREALAHVGHVTVRNRGTVGGSVAHADAAAELPLSLVALGGEVEVRGPRGSRRIDADELFAFHLTTTLEPDELITDVRFTETAPRSGWGFAELARRHGDFAMASVAAVVELGEQGELEAARVAVGGVSSTPRRAHASERALTGSAFEDTAIDSAADAARELVDSGADDEAQLAYRRRLVAALTGRALRAARERAHPSAREREPVA